MKKSMLAFLTVVGTAGGLLLAIGMCMCLLPEWNAFTPGVVLAAIGAVTLLACWPIARRASGKAAGKRALPFNGKLVLTYSIGVVGTLVLGVGMCLTMVWGASYMIPGIVVGCVGLLVCALNLVLHLGGKAA